MCKLWAVNITLHDVRTTHEQEPLVAGVQLLEVSRVDDFDGNAGHWLAGSAAPHADLVMFTFYVVRDIERDNRRTFGTSVAFERFDRELVLELLPQVVRERRATYSDLPEREKVVGRTFVRYRLQNFGSRRDQAHAIFAA